MRCDGVRFMFFQLIQKVFCHAARKSWNVKLVIEEIKSLMTLEVANSKQLFPNKQTNKTNNPEIDISNKKAVQMCHLNERKMPQAILVNCCGRELLSSHCLRILARLFQRTGMENRIPL